MPRRICLAAVAMIAFAALPSAAMAEKGATSAAARECVVNTAPGKERGQCVQSIANPNAVAPVPTWTVVDNGPYIWDATMRDFRLNATNIPVTSDPQFVYVVATNVTTGQEIWSGVHYVYPDGSVQNSGFVFACPTGNVISFQLYGSYAYDYPANYGPRDPIGSAQQLTCV